MAKNGPKSAAERNRLFRKRHPEVVERNTLEQRKTREWVSSLKENPCVDCGNSYPTYVMDWDHVRGLKTMNVADMRKRNTKLSKILAEIEKCDLVCSNCHRIRTYMRSMSKTKVEQT